MLFKASDNDVPALKDDRLFVIDVIPKVTDATLGVKAVLIEHDEDISLTGLNHKPVFYRIVTLVGRAITGGCILQYSLVQDRP